MGLFKKHNAKKIAKQRERECELHEESIQKQEEEIKMPKFHYGDKVRIIKEGFYHGEIGKLVKCERTSKYLGYGVFEEDAFLYTVQLSGKESSTFREESLELLQSKK